MKYGKRILCNNRGHFYMREVIRSGKPTLYVDDALTTFTPAQVVARGWAAEQPINWVRK